MALALCLTGPASAFEALSHEVIACPMPLPPGEIDGQTVTCGRIEVPSDWDAPENGRTMWLTYQRQHARSLSPLPDPVIYFTGGPGVSILSQSDIRSYSFPYLRDDRDIVIYDQRGVTWSTPLTCPAEVQAAGRLAHPDPGAMPEGGRVDEIAAWARAAMLAQGWGACLEDFADRGIYPAAYSSRVNARDAVALMGALDAPEYNLFGISYGTQLALEVVETVQAMEDGPALRSLLIDGVFPRNVPFAETALPVQLNVLAMLRDCAEETDCGTAYGDLSGVLPSFLDRLDASPLTRRNAPPLTGRALVTEVFDPMIARVRTDLLFLLPRIVADLEAGRTDGVELVTALLREGERLDAPLAQADTLSLRLEAAAEEAADLEARAARAETLLSRDLPARDAWLTLATRNMARLPLREARGLAQRLAADPPLPSPQGLAQAADLFPDDAPTLRALAARLTEAEAAQIVAVLTAPVQTALREPMNVFVSMLVPCNDRGATIDLASMLTYRRDEALPQFAPASGIGGDAQRDAFCDLAGLGQPSGPPPPPVESAIPALVMNGRADHATPAEWAALAAESLSSATLVIVPATDHGATRFHDCTRDIAAAFVHRPDLVPDTACASELAPDWLLPDDPFPPLP